MKGLISKVLGTTLALGSLTTNTGCPFIIGFSYTGRTVTYPQPQQPPRQPDIFCFTCNECKDFNGDGRLTREEMEKYVYGQNEPITFVLVPNKPVTAQLIIIGPNGKPIDDSLSGISFTTENRGDIRISRSTRGLSPGEYLGVWKIKNEPSVSGRFIIK